MIGIVDGYTGEPNIYADDIGEYNISVWGEQDCVLPVGNELAYTLVSNNEIKIKDGIFVTQGRRGLIKRNTTETARIENGSQGMKRHDLIVIEYSKDNSSTKEKHSLKVIKGTAAAQAQDPAVMTGNIRNGDSVHQMPLYRVVIDGLNITKVEKMFELVEKPLSSVVKDCFQSVSDGKRLVASAITDKRVPTDAADTFAQMAENIKKIVLGSGNAVAADVLQGRTFTNDDGVQYTGTMPNNTLPFSVQIFAKSNDGDQYYGYLPTGYYPVMENGNAYFYIPTSLLRSVLGITASKIIQGQSIAGVAGTVVAAPKSLKGSDKYWQAHEQVTRTVTFSTPFATTPSVNVSGNIRDSGGTVKNMGVNVTSKSKAGFTYRTDTPPNYGDATVTWNAVV